MGNGGWEEQTYTDRGHEYRKVSEPDVIQVHSDQQDVADDANGERDYHVNSTLAEMVR